MLLEHPHGVLNASPHAIKGAEQHRNLIITLEPKLGGNVAQANVGRGRGDGPHWLDDQIVQEHDEAP